MADTNTPVRENKDLMIRVRVTIDEREKFFYLAQKHGYRTVSEYIRSLLQEKDEQDDSIA